MPESTKNSLAKAQAVFLVHSYFVLYLLTIYVALRAFEFAAEAIAHGLGVVTLALCIWSLYSWRVIGRPLFSPYPLFFIAATLFNAGQIILEPFGMNPNGILDGRVPPESVLRTEYFITVALGCLHLGALAAARNAAKASQQASGLCTNTSARPSARVIGWLLISVALVPTFLILSDLVQSAMLSGYFDAVFRREAATGFEAAPRALAAFLVPGCIFLIAGSQRSRTALVGSLVLMFSYAVANLFVGSRSVAILPLIAYAWVWHRCVRPLSRPLLIGAIVIAVPLLSAVASMRNSVGDQRAMQEFLVAAQKSPGEASLELLRETGTSMLTVAYTIDLVPNVRPYDLGASYFFSLFTVFPNVFWDLHPAVQRGTPNNWLIWTVDPYMAAAGGGVGYSFLAEAYLNFGWLGAHLAVAALGYLFGRLTCWAEDSGNAARVAMIGSGLSFFLKYARSDASEVVRPWVWYALVPYLACVLVSRLGTVSGARRLDVTPPVSFPRPTVSA
jgi:hypothetical protein